MTSFSIHAGQLLMNILNVESTGGIEEAEFDEDALQITLSLGIVGILPLLILFDEIFRDLKLRYTFIAVLQKILPSFHHKFSRGLKDDIEIEEGLSDTRSVGSNSINYSYHSE